MPEDPWVSDRGFKDWASTIVTTIVNRLVTAERALRTAAPHQLLDAVRRVLTDQYAADSVELYLADYGLTVLQPVSVPPHTLQPVSVHNSPAGRAFGAQEPYVETLPGDSGDGVRVHLPVTVRGDRLGVLTVTLPGGEHADGCLGELAEIAEVLGHEVVVAERDTDVYLQARRRDRLTLAAEMQWQLLPGRSCSRPEYELGAQLEPAYAIFGDNFDWSATADRLSLYVTNGMGEGIEASLLTNLAINALRNARRAGLPLADQAALADQAVYAHYRGRCYLSVLMLDIELATGRVRAVDAGSRGCCGCAGARWSGCRSTPSFRSACSRRPTTWRRSSWSSPVTGWSSSATACTTPGRRAERRTGPEPWPGRSSRPGCSGPPRCPGPSCANCPATVAEPSRTTTPWWCVSTGVGGEDRGRRRSKGMDERLFGGVVGRP
ncbi:hypothetical protein SVIOM74S_04076 [Streptomyces violarus]